MAVGGGGFASGPVVAVAAASGVPGLALEADAHLGVANRLLRPFVKRFCLSFPIDGLEPPRYVVTGRPLSPAQLDATPEQGREAFDLRPDLPVVLAFGGSQGAQSINRACVDAFGGKELDFQLVHVCGPKNADQVRRELDDRGERFERYRLVPYTDRLAAAMAAADLVVARSGGSVAELAALGKPAILVPYPYATADHQRKNAREMVAGGAALLVDDAELERRAAGAPGRGADRRPRAPRRHGGGKRRAGQTGRRAPRGRPDRGHPDHETRARGFDESRGEGLPAAGPLHRYRRGGDERHRRGAPRARRRRARLGPQGLPLHAPPHRGRRPRHRRARRRQPRRRRPGRDVHGHRRGQPGAARRARRRTACAPARRDARPRHGAAPRHRRGRHPRQDDHVVDDLPRAAAGRSRPDVPGRRRAQRHRLQRRGGRGGVAGRRGRRERREPAVPAPRGRDRRTTWSSTTTANYACLDDVHDVFRRFVALLPEDGLLVLVAGSGGEALAAYTPARVLVVGIGEGDLRAEVERVDDRGSVFTAARRRRRGARPGGTAGAGRAQRAQRAHGARGAAPRRASRRRTRRRTC